MKVRKINKTKAEIKMYGNIGSWFTNADVLTDVFDALETDGYEEVAFRVHCYGGSVFEGNAMAVAFQRTKLKVSMLIEGISASMACLILPYLNPENVSIVSNGFGMIHCPKGGGYGDAEEHLSTAKLLQDIENNFIDTLHARTQLPKEEIKAKWFNGKDHWLNAKEMKRYKLVGSIVDSIAKIPELDRQILEMMDEEAAYNKYAAYLPIKNNQILHQMNKELLISAFGLTGVTAESSDADILKALQDKMNGLENRVNELANAALEKDKLAITAAIDKAEKEGKLVPSAGQTKESIRANYQKIGETAGIEALNAVLDSIQPTKRIFEHINAHGGGNDNPAAGRDWKWYQENDPSCLEKMSKDNPEAFRELYKKEYGSYPA